MIGDVLTSSILLDRLREHFPEAQLDYLINENTLAVVSHHPSVDEFLIFTPEMDKKLSAFLSFLNDVKNRSYDIVIDVYGNLRSQLITRRSGAPIRIGYQKKQSFVFYTHSIPRLKQPEHNASLAIENRMKLLEPLSIPFQHKAPRIVLKDYEIEAAARFLTTHKLDLTKPIYMIAVLGSSPAKTYPSEYMASLLDTIVETKPEAQLLFNYIPSQKEDAKVIYDATTPITQKNIFFDVYGRSLRDFIAIAHHCDALIGNEGGAVNMAKALHRSTFIIFSPHLNKANWFGNTETKKHQAVHLSDFISHDAESVAKAKKQPKFYYLKFKPTFIQPKLIAFLSSLK